MDGRGEGRRDIRSKLRDRLRLCVVQRVDHRRSVRAAERQLAREHLVQHDAEAEDVGAMIDLAADRLLRRHVGQRPDHRAGLRDPGARLGFARVRQLGDAEVEDAHASAGGDDHVRRLQIPVDDAGAVRRGHGVGDLQRVVDGGADWQPVRRNQRVERLPVDVLHDDEVHVVVAADVVDGDDVRMVERGGGARLAQKARPLRRRCPLGEHLDCHVALQPRIAGEIDGAHAALSDLPEN